MVALVVARAGSALSSMQVIDHCARELPGYKVPVACRLVDPLPRTPSGKVDRPALRRQADPGQEER